jgi:hypothetical protein
MIVANHYICATPLLPCIAQRGSQCFKCTAPSSAAKPSEIRRIVAICGCCSASSLTESRRVEHRRRHPGSAAAAALPARLLAVLCRLLVSGGVHAYVGYLAKPAANKFFRGPFEGRTGCSLARHNVLDLLYLKRRRLSLRLRRTEGSEPQLRRAGREAV